MHAAEAGMGGSALGEGAGAVRERAGAGSALGGIVGGSVPARAQSFATADSASGLARLPDPDRDKSIFG
jgi:hypothetical protein